MSILHVQHGEVISDDAMNFAIGLPSGIYECGTPTVIGTGPWTVTLPVAASGFILWRDAGSGSTHGRTAVMEVASITWTVPKPSSNPRIDILVGARHWAASSPLGTMTAEMGPAYGCVMGTEGSSPVAPTLPSYTPAASSYFPSSTAWTPGSTNPGGVPIPILQISVPVSGTISASAITFLPATDMRLSGWGATYAEIVAGRGGYANLDARMAAIASSSGATFPPGVILASAASAVPTGWLMCDGSSVNRTTYAPLFAAIGTTFGNGDGSTTFNLPSLLGVFPLGANSTYPMNGTPGGEATHVLTIPEMPAHTHAVAPYSGPTTGSAHVNAGTISGPQGSLTGSAGGGNAHNNMPPYLALNHIIKT